MKSLIRWFALTLVLGAARASAQPAPTIASLTASSVVDGFKATAVYTDAANRPIGARFIHQKTGFTLDVIRQQSVPQAHIWVTSFPMNDMGAPHTQEHLLVGKGAKGRALGSIEAASLTTSGAFTDQWRTNYTFNTSAGAKAFYSLVGVELDALMNPDFSDEEIRREVRNFGITDDPATHALGLEEKGSVYNEMVSSTTSPFSVAFDALGRMVYGNDHPLSLNSGGTPEGIRHLTAADIRRFHDEHYYLANMGMIIAIPDAMPLGTVLSQIGTTLDKENRTPSQRASITSMAQLPAPAPKTPGMISVLDYPHRNPEQPGLMAFAWPATRPMGPNEQQLMSLFLNTVAGDPTTNLYKMFVDTKTRTMDLGAKQLFAFYNDEPGNPVYIALDGVLPSHMNTAEIGAVRTAIATELSRIAAMPDGSPQLREFEDRVRSRILSSRRALSKFVNSPPGFGFRNTGNDWLVQLDVVNREDGFKKSLVLAPAMHFADSVVSSSVNPWRTYLAKWQLTTVKPYGVATKPSSAAVDSEDARRKARAAAEVARLRSVYSASDDQAAIQRYKADYDKNSAELDRLTTAVPAAKLVDDLPMTLDDQLQYKTDTVHGVPIVSSTFESMTSMTAGLHLRTDAIRDDELVYLASMPALLATVGLNKAGHPESYDAMSERQRREILSLDADWSTNSRTGRVELVIHGAGNDQSESIKALGWMRDILTAPDWRVENLPRIRDVIDQTLTGARTEQQAAPEAWVEGVANAYRRQDNPRYLTAVSFFTQEHFFLRLKWLLTDPGADAQRAALDTWLRSVSAASQTAPGGAELRTRLVALLKTPDTASLPAGARKIAADLNDDLAQTLPELPDASLAGDWKYLADQLRADLLTPPAQALAQLDAVRQKLLVTGGARVSVVSSSATRKAVAPALGALLAALTTGPAPQAAAAPSRGVDERLSERTSGGAKPVFVSLLDQNMQGGVMMNSVPLVSYADTSARALTRFLASKIYGGGGAHSVFSQTIAAGLAYSNGIGGSPTSTRLTYYAERTPTLPQTLSFVIDRLKASPHDTALVTYALTLVFSETRGGASFEDRAEGIANDLADGQTPAEVRRFRERILALRKSNPTLGKAMYAQMDSVYAQLLPGYFPGMPNVAGSVYFTIGAEKQQTAYQQYLHSAVSPDATLFQLYPRDFWIVAPSTRRIVP